MNIFVTAKCGKFSSEFCTFSFLYDLVTNEARISWRKSLALSLSLCVCVGDNTAHRSFESNSPDVSRLCYYLLFCLFLMASCISSKFVLDFCNSFDCKGGLWVQWSFSFSDLQASFVVDTYPCFLSSLKKRSLHMHFYNIKSKQHIHSTFLVHKSTFLFLLCSKLRLSESIVFIHCQSV